MVPIEVVRGSLLEQDVEAIVNAANTAMRGGSGIDGAIHRAAGKELIGELMRVAPHGAKAGKVVVTPGFKTGFRYIFHTAGPIWRGGLNGEPALLADCYRNATLEAERLGVRTLGFCSISTGVYSYPLERAAPIALNTVRETATNLDRVVFAMFGEKEYEVFAKLANG
ncbi:macro domain-containing protein [Fimbriimonas ginsengisoli]|uniref:Macro domain-containing protein n=1 Tax=Fimbriimonas ginsengisoli Gsoil 348 TaxID=661478 RepID=A0A068NNR9_FIMGI|nr:macro domain-containing protein [Fimbriimonas ginsengisoli]AIE85066.1 hypothetical protein OP10G_1698 [Fimbriimonas ginsengisoli Gsoil 348]